jgi:hypothetical protein
MNGKRDFVTVVSGLPRSGTSMAMQMLRAGGMPVLVDDARPADADNPAGYLEYAPVLATARDASWVAQAPGKAVKVIYALLRHLPPGFAYRVLWMRRNLDEVIASQQAMLARRGAVPSEGLSQRRLAAVFAAQLAEAEAWLAQQPSFQLLAVDHAELLEAPQRVAGEICGFLSGRLDAAAMATCVDPALRRQRRQ